MLAYPADRFSLKQVNIPLMISQNRANAAPLHRRSNPFDIEDVLLSYRILSMEEGKQTFF